MAGLLRGFSLKYKKMKITKDTQTVWNIENDDIIIGVIIATKYKSFLVRLFDNKTFYVTEYTKAEMIEVYELTEDQFDNINRSGI